MSVIVNGCVYTVGTKKQECVNTMQHNSVTLSKKIREKKSTFAK
jgi:hypothetical protein